MHAKLLVNRGRKFRVFLSGDYEFQCHMYGISGAAGCKISNTACDLISCTTH